MTRTVVGVYRESVPGERRVALTPPVAGRLRDFGLDIMVEASAGEGAGFPDAAFRQVGAQVVTHAVLLDTAGLLVGVNPPGIDASHRFRPGQILLGLLRPTENALLLRRWAEQGLTTLSLDLVPAGLVGASRLDAAASQLALAGSRAALLALLHLDRPLETDRQRPDEGGPPQVRALVIGGGADARQCALTLGRLGAMTHVWHPDAGATDHPAGLVPLRLRSNDGFGALAEQLPAFDVVVTALRVGDRAPLVLRQAAVRSLLPGSLVLDLTASPLGGNVEGAVPDCLPRREGLVTLIGAPDLAAQLPAAASAGYACAMEAVLARLLVSGAPHLDRDDPFQVATLVTYQGEVVHEATWQRVLDVIQFAGSP